MQKKLGRSGTVREFMARNSQADTLVEGVLLMITEDFRFLCGLNLSKSFLIINECWLSLKN